jgi:hypothetical protein
VRQAVARPVAQPDAPLRIQLDPVRLSDLPGMRAWHEPCQPLTHPPAPRLRDSWLLRHAPIVHTPGRVSSPDPEVGPSYRSEMGPGVGRSEYDVRDQTLTPSRFAFTSMRRVRLVGSGLLE